MTNVRLITSQARIYDDVVEAKRAEGDYDVQVSPIFEIDGQPVRFIIEGIHSLKAAMLDSVEPELEEYDASECDAISYLDKGDVDGFINAVWDSALYYVDDDTMVF